ncbi:MAG: oligosaccharide flippase family protein [Treponema sp.]|nr:oligosaccharide flippase family protein [Treponema sp.]
MVESPKEIKAASIKSNYIFNTFRTVLNLIVPLIVFPYISRVLGPESLGKVEFANSIVSYFVLFTALGIPTYGIRETARTRGESLFERLEGF